MIHSAEKTVQTFFTSATGITITRWCSFVSALCSAVTIYIIILKSPQSTTRIYAGNQVIYHRIMFMLSLGTLIASASMSLTTLPMPADMIYTQFEGLSIGTTATCTAQGALVCFGFSISFCYMGILCVYYLCSIKYGICDLQYSRRIEPLLHLFSIVSSTVLSAVKIKLKMFNPTPRQSYCAADLYPYGCTDADNDCLIRGNFNMQYIEAMRIQIILIFVSIVISLGMIIFHICKAEVKEGMLQTNNLDEEDGSGDRIDQSTKLMLRLRQGKSIVERLRSIELIRTKTVILQCSCYFLIYSICFTMPFLWSRTDWALTSTAFQALYISSWTLQGLYNLLIFLYHKAHQLLQQDADLTLLAAVKLIFTTRTNPERIIFSDATSPNYMYSQFYIEERNIEREYIGTPTDSAELEEYPCSKDSSRVDEASLAGLARSTSSRDMLTTNNQIRGSSASGWHSSDLDKN